MEKRFVEEESCYQALEHLTALLSCHCTITQPSIFVVPYAGKDAPCFIPEQWRMHVLRYLALLSLATESPSKSVFVRKGAASTKHGKQLDA